MDRIFRMMLLAAVFFFLTGCNYDSPVKVDAKETSRGSSWIAYWDLDAGEKDLQRIGNKLDKLSYFGAYFDQDDRLFIPQELSEKQKKLKSQKANYEIYLTFINDKQNSDGSAELKDIEVLRRLFVDDAAIEKHIDEIITMTLQGGYNGIEIDYERIWTDPKIGQSFLNFTDKLYAKALKNNLKLRIVLEPGSPFATGAFPNGPDYVVMVYNLYGLHSGPGPKADKEFIQKTLTRMEALPGCKWAAFSTGGCLWGDNGEKRFLSEVEAKTLAVTYDAAAKRDKGSQCLVFAYKDKGVSYQVWYADVETLNYWIAIAKTYGIGNISLWRMGGNVDLNKILL